MGDRYVTMGDNVPILAKDLGNGKWGLATFEQASARPTKGTPMLSRATVGNESTQLIEANPDRLSIVFFNFGDVDAELFPEPGGVWGEGWPFPAGSTVDDDRTICAWYALTQGETGETTVAVMEITP